MNNIRSVGYGWGALIVAGGGAYYFAKRQVNADRDEKHRIAQERRELNARYAEQERLGGTGSLRPVGGNGDNASNPSREASTDPAPTRHAPTTESEKFAEKSKYEASQVWRSKKGDRFS